jgi:hypothetical protein
MHAKIATQSAGVPPRGIVEFVIKAMTSSYRFDLTVQTNGAISAL